MNAPLKIRSGDTIAWTEEFGDYSSTSGWAFKVRLVGETSYAAITASGSGTTYTVTIAASITATYLPGTYKLIGWVEKGSERYTMFETTIAVTANQAITVSDAGALSHARRTLALIESAIESYAVRPVEEITIAGRTLRRPALATLVTLRSRYQYFVRQEEGAERSANGLDFGGRINVRFGSVT